MQNYSLILAGYYEAFYKTVKKLYEKNYIPDYIVTHPENFIKNVVYDSKKINRFSRSRVFFVESFNEFLKECGDHLKSKVILISIGFMRKLPTKISDNSILLNVHGGDLPKYRGRNPVAYAILNGEDSVGITVHKISEEIDGGDILLKKYVRITEEDDVNSMNAKLNDMIPDIVVESIRLIETNQYNFYQNDFSKYKVNEKILPQKVLEGDTIEIFERKYKATVYPYPGLFFEGRRILRYSLEKNEINNFAIKLKNGVVYVSLSQETSN